VPTLQDVVASMGAASHARIIDYRILELLKSISGSYGTLSRQQKAELIIQFLGAENILKKKEIRNVLFLSLDTDVSQELAESLSINVSKLYDFHLSGVRLSKMRTFFGLPEHEEEVIVDEKSDECIICDGTGNKPEFSPFYSLYDYQRTAMYGCNNILNHNEVKRVMLHMPTGSGKTRTAMHLVCRELCSKEPSTVLWLANGKELCDQAADEFEQAWARLGDRPASALRFYGGDSEWDPEFNDGLVVAGLQKLWNYMTKDVDRVNPLAEKISLIVFDEAHQSVANTYKQMTEILLNFNPNIKLLGLSATPGRAHHRGDEREDEQLVNLFRGNKIRLRHPDYDSAISYLISSGFLSTINYHNIDYLSEELEEADANRIAESFKIPDDVLTELGLDVQRNLALLEHVFAIAENHQRILLFAPSVGSSNLLAAVLRQQGYLSTSITSETPKDERQGIIDRFKSNEQKCMILCNYGVLTTGFDAPKISAIIIARPTSSIVLYSQMVGRGIRGIRMKGTEEADIYTVQDTSIPVFVNIVQQFRNWEESWGDLDD